MKGKHEKKQFSVLLAFALCVLITVTFMPSLMFSSRAEENAKSAVVQSFNSIGDTALEADSEGSAQAKVSSTYAAVTGTVSEDGSEKTDASIPVKWTQDTAKSSDSSYVFQAQLKDEENKDTDGDGVIYSLKDSSVTLPEVTVKKVESASAETADSNQSSSGKIYGTRKSTVTTFTNPTADSLGSVGKFGVFANDYEQTGDMEGSVATQKLSANGNIGRSSRVQNFDPQESYNYIGTFTSIFRSHAETGEDWIFGDNVKLDNQYNKTESNNDGLRAIDGKTEIHWNHVSELGSSAQNAKDAQYQINFADAFDGLRAYASAQSRKSQESNKGAEVHSNVGEAGVDQNNYEIKVNCKEGFDVVNLSASDLQRAKLTITGPANGNYSLIINVTGMTESDYSFTKDVSIDGENGTGDDYSQFSPKIGKVLFNFDTYSRNINYNGNNYAGDILAPDATVNFSTGHHAGSVYANKVVSSVEIHQIDFTPVTPTPTPTPEHAKVKFSVKKNFDGNWNGKIFKFTLTQVNGFSNERSSWGSSPSDSGSKDVTISGEDTDHTHTKAFGEITYDKDGDYYYEIKEKKGDDTDISYDSNVYLIKVSVNDGKTETSYCKVDQSKVNEVKKSDLNQKYTDETKFAFTNTAKQQPQTTKVSVTKHWEDSDNQDGIRPKEVKVQLYADNEPVGADQGGLVTLSAEHNWYHEWTGLSEKKDGKPIKYTVKEQGLPSGYTSKVTGDASNGFTITNTHQPDDNKTQVSVQKKWVLDNGRSAAKSVQVQLYKNNEAYGRPVTLEDGNNWTKVWTDLDKTDQRGNTISWTVDEVNVPNGFTHKVSGSDNNYTITNDDKPDTPTPVTPTSMTYTVHKVWNLDAGQNIPDSVQVQLYQNGKAYRDPVTVEKSKGWTYTWAGLPQGNWSVKEIDPEHKYTSSVVSGPSSATVTNTPNNKTNDNETQVKVHKTWVLDDGRTAASSVQAQLYKNGEAYGNPVTLNAGNSWTHIWTGLTKTDAQGNTISWTVKEVNTPTGFSSKVSGSDNNYTITNDDKPKDGGHKNNTSQKPNSNTPTTPGTNGGSKTNKTVTPGTGSGTTTNGGTAANSSRPKTGDTTPIGIYAGVLAAAAAGLGAVLFYLRRRENK